MPDWDLRRGWPGTIRAWMKKMGWSEAGHWAWRSPAGRIELTHTADKLARQEAAHRLREQWRRQQVGYFLQQERRDSSQLRHQLGLDWYDEAAICKARKIHNHEGHKLAVLSGSAVSPALLAVCAARRERRDVKEAEAACPWCNVEWGTWDHCCWQCPSNVPPVPVPACTFQRRLGWPTAGNASDRTVLAHMATTRRLLLSARGQHDSRFSSRRPGDVELLLPDTAPGPRHTAPAPAPAATTVSPPAVAAQSTATRLRLRHKSAPAPPLIAAPSGAAPSRTALQAVPSPHQRGPPGPRSQHSPHRQRPRSSPAAGSSAAACTPPNGGPSSQRPGTPLPPFLPSSMCSPPGGTITGGGPVPPPAQAAAGTAAASSQAQPSSGPPRTLPQPRQRPPQPQPAWPLAPAASPFAAAAHDRESASPVHSSRSSSLSAPPSAWSGDSDSPRAAGRPSC